MGSALLKGGIAAEPKRVEEHQAANSGAHDQSVVVERLEGGDSPTGGQCSGNQRAALHDAAFPLPAEHDQDYTFNTQHQS